MVQDDYTVVFKDRPRPLPLTPEQIETILGQPYTGVTAPFVAPTSTPTPTTVITTEEPVTREEAVRIAARSPEVDTRIQVPEQIDEPTVLLQEFRPGTVPTKRIRELEEKERRRYEIQRLEKRILSPVRENLGTTQYDPNAPFQAKILSSTIETVAKPAITIANPELFEKNVKFFQDFPEEIVPFISAGAATAVSPSVLIPLLGKPVVEKVREGKVNEAIGEAFGSAALIGTAAAAGKVGGKALERAATRQAKQFKGMAGRAKKSKLKLKKKPTVEVKKLPPRDLRKVQVQTKRGLETRIVESPRTALDKRLARAIRKQKAAQQTKVVTGADIEKFVKSRGAPSKDIQRAIKRLTEREKRGVSTPRRFVEQPRKLPTIDIRKLIRKPKTKTKPIKVETTKIVRTVKPTKPRGRGGRVFRKAAQQRAAKNLAKSIEKARRIQEQQEAIAAVQSAAQRSAQIQGIGTTSALSLSGLVALDTAADVTAQIDSQKDLQQQSQRQSQRQAQDQDQALAQAQAQESAELTKVSVPTIGLPTIPVRTFRQRPTRRERQIEIVPPQEQFKTPQKRKIKERLSPKIPLIPNIPLTIKARRTITETPSGYNVYVKKTKRIVKLNPKPVSRKSALSIGAKFVDDNISDSFTIKKTKGLVKEQVRDNAFDVLGFKFKKSKKNPNVLVEKKQFRLDKPLERMQIQKARRGRLRGII